MNFHAKHVTGARALTTQTLVQMKYDEAGGDLNKAADLVVAAARKTTLADEFIRIGARTLLGQVGIATRTAIDRERSGAADARKPYTVNAGMRDAQRRVARRGQNHISALFDKPFKWEGRDVRLGDLTGLQAAAIARPMMEAGRATLNTARWLLAVAEAAGDRRIQDAVTSEVVEALEHDTRLPA